MLALFFRAPKDAEGRGLPCAGRRPAREGEVSAGSLAAWWTSETIVRLIPWHFFLRLS